jgi:glucose/mannose-6-phosphate isomerase
MLSWVSSLPQQLADSRRLPGLARLRSLPQPPRQVVVCGMGGSAMAAEVAAPLAAGAGVRLAVWRDYDLPGWIEPDALVVGASYSGDTEETVSAVAAARRLGCPVVVLTAGGHLLSLGQADAGESLSAVELPSGLAPRAAFGYMLGALVAVLARLGIETELAAQIDGAIETLNEGNTRYLSGMERTSVPPTASVPAPDLGEAADAAAVSLREFAEVVAGRFVVIYSSGHEAHGAGARLKAQLNENAKTPAYHVRFPELDHNDIVGWELAAADRGRFALIALCGGDETSAQQRRVSVTLATLAEDLPVSEVVRSRGAQPLARALSLVQWGDYFSCFLARARGVDPLPVTRIDRLKRALEERS